MWFYVWAFHSLNDKLNSILQLLLEWESLMHCAWVVVFKYLKLLMERRCPKTEMKITGFCISMLFSTDKELFAVCCPFLFVKVVNEKDTGSDLLSC